MYRSAGTPINTLKFKFTAPTPVVYTDAEIRSILLAANGRDKMLYQTLLMSGLRLQEAQTLEFANLLDTGIQVCVHGDWSPKTSEERLIRVPRQLVEELRRLARVNGSELVFPTRRGTPNTIMLRSLKRTAKRAGLDPADCWIHKFRACFATRLLRAGLPLPDVSRQLGHASVITTQRYLALLPADELQDKIEQCWK
jgi:integrase